MVRKLGLLKRSKAKSQDDLTGEFYRLVKIRYPGIPDAIEKVVYRVPSGSINVRIIDPSFESTRPLVRDELLGDLVAQLPPEFERDLGLLLLFTPAEAKGSMSYMMPAFDDPFGCDC